MQSLTKSPRPKPFISKPINWKKRASLSEKNADKEKMRMPNAIINRGSLMFKIVLSVMQEK